VDYPKDSVLKYGFEDINQLNAFRYADFCFQQFMEAAQKEKYFDNTIFVFVGDHGLAGDASAMYPKSWSNQSLVREHVPCFFMHLNYCSQNKFARFVHNWILCHPLQPCLNMSYSNNSMDKVYLIPRYINPSRHLSLTMKQEPLAW
jgi:hypothetical protein